MTSLTDSKTDPGTDATASAVPEIVPGAAQLASDPATRSVIGVCRSRRGAAMVRRQVPR